MKLSNFKELCLSQFLSDLDDLLDQLIRITSVILSPLLGNGAALLKPNCETLTTPKED